MDFHFILIEPAVPGNIGASARAIKTMGFYNLILINPCTYLEGEALWLAHGSVDVLEKAQIYPDFKSSIEDFDLVIGTTANTQRSAKGNFVPLSQLGPIIEEKKGNLNKVALVFGREESGMTNDELRCCDLVSTVPLKTSFPSLNLSQAVMLYAYELSKLSVPLHEEIIPDHHSLNKLREKIHHVLLRIEMKEGSNIFNRIMERISFLQHDDINLLHSILAKLEKKRQY